MCANAAKIESAIEAELTASELLGMPWRERDFESPEEIEADLGGELVDEIAAHGGPGALVLLEGIAALAGPALAKKASRRADQIGSNTEPPSLIEAIGTAQPERTAMISESTFDDGRTWFIESVNDHGERLTVGIYIDHNFGCVAKDILVATTIGEIREVYEESRDPAAAISFEDVDPTLAAARIRAAMELTDQTLGLLTADEYASYRALTLNRVAALPEAEPDDGRSEVTETEREALLGEFLASPEAEAEEIKPESDAASVVACAIDFAADYTDGRPFRWSPVSVGIFMVDWLPHKVVADDEYFAAAPEALSTWIRFAGRRRDLPDAAVDQTLEAVSEFARDLADKAAAPSGGDDPAGGLIAAMREAGIDPSDEEALQTFIAGWNARSLLD